VLPRHQAVSSASPFMSARQVVLETPSESSHPSYLISRQHHAPLNAFVATLTQPPSMRCKQTTYAISNSFRCNTCKKHGGWRLRTNSIPQTSALIIKVTRVTSRRDARHCPPAAFGLRLGKMNTRLPRSYLDGLPHARHTNKKAAYNLRKGSTSRVG